MIKRLNNAEIQKVKGGNNDQPDKPIGDGMFVTPDGMINLFALRKSRANSL